MSKVHSAVGWSAIDIMFRNGLGFVVTMILARILMPEDFGAIAMLGILTSIASLFVDGGFSQALIQNQSVTASDESSVFFFNLAMGGVISLGLCLLAPWVAVFYEMPSLRLITMAMAANLFLNAFGSVHNALLTKKLGFSVLAKVGATATLLGGVSGITAAVLGLGVWSLVIQIWVCSCVTVALLWFWHPWRPLMTFQFSAIRHHFRFSGYLVLSGLMYRIYGNLFALVIGKAHSVQDAGYYAQASKLQQLASTILTAVVSRVAFPSFSAANDDHDKLRRGLSKALGVTMFVSVPVSFSISLLAEPIVLLLFGNQWLPSVPIVKVLGLSAMLMPVHMLNISVLKAMGRSDLNFRVMLVKFIVGISLLLAASPMGLVAIAWAFVLSNVINFFVNTYYTKNLLSFGAARQIKIVWGYIAAAVPLALVIMMFQGIFGSQNSVLILVALPLGLMSYLISCMLLRLSAIDEIRQIVRQRRSKMDQGE